MKILVTGGAGFVGSCLVKELHKHHEVTVIDNLSTGFVNNIPEDVEFIKGDIGSETDVSKLYGRRFDVIYHIAGQSSGEISYDDPVYDLNTNTKSTLLLLKFAESCSCSNFIFMSSMSVYGDRIDRPVLEGDETSPLSFYGVGKLASEHYLRIDNNKDMRKTVLRLCNTYGPGQNMDNLRQGMVSIFIKQAVDHGKVLVKGSKDRFRDFIHISDVVDALVLLLDDYDYNFEIFNLTGGVKKKVSDLVEAIHNGIDTDLGVLYSGSTPGDQFGVCANNSKIKKNLSWEPKVGFEEGIINMVKWYKNL